MEIEILGIPNALKRARIKQKKFYDPNAKDKEIFQWDVIRALNYLEKRSSFPKKKPICLSIQFYFPFPKSLSKKKKEELLGSPHWIKPDIDNLIKFVGDACNKILWKDDAQIYYIEAFKGYSDNPRTIIGMDELPLISKIPIIRKLILRKKCKMRKL